MVQGAFVFSVLSMIGYRDLTGDLSTDRSLINETWVYR